ncbi:MAG TPA: DUF4214 domain-containing protein [Pirellulales bacterium]|nr:DUF4214 domain-containing protein [Pirellulales bacterium]
MTQRFRRPRRSPSRRSALNKRMERPLAKLEMLENRLLLAVTDLTTNTAYATIQAAVNGANPGDTLLADPGTYAENVTINKSIILEGAQHGVDAQTRNPVNESVVTGVGNNGDTPFYITASDVTIDGFTVEGATNSNDFGYGILEAGGTSGTQILNNIIQDNIIGLGLANASSAAPGLVQHNLIQNNNEAGPGSGAGIYSDQFVAGGSLTSVKIDSNTFAGNTGDSGIDFSTTDATKPATDIAISNNVFDANARGLVAFNLTSSTITSNTFSNSTNNATADIRLFEGDNGVAITNNLMENGAGYALRISNDGTGSPNATNISFNYNSVSGYTGASGAFAIDAGAYTGTLDASKDWWGDVSGPTIASNVGGLGQTIVDPNSQITFAPWLIYGTDADSTAPGFQLPTTVPVASLGDVSPAVNDFTLLQNAIGAAASGQTIDLSGPFDWTTTNSSAAYAASTNTAPTADIRGIALPDGVSNLTITSSAQNATITGVGDSTDAAYNAFVFSAVEGAGATGNTNLTISNLAINDFESGVFLGWNNGGTFNGTLVKNNTITLAGDSDNNQADGFQSIAVYFWNGQNQTMTGNTIDFMGDGTRTTGNGAFSYGFQDGTTGGTGYNGLSIDHNIFQLLPSAVGSTEVITGVWENGHNDDNASHITISQNQFLGIQGQRLLDNGLQLSSQTSNMSIDSNTFTDVKYVYWVGTHNGDAPGDQFTFTNNVLTRVGDANGIFLQNRIDNAAPGDVITINWSTNNTIDGFTGIRGLNELSTQATGASRPTGAASDLDAVVAFGPMPVDFVNSNWGSPDRFSNPLTTPDGTPGPIAFGFNTFTTVQDGVNAVDVGGTTNVLPGTYAENVIIDKDITLTGMTLTGTTALPPTAIISPAGGDGITIGAPATDVTVGDLEVTGAATGIVASNLSALNLSDLTLTGNTVAGGTLTNITTVNDTPLTGSTGATDTITGSSIQRGTDDAINYSGVTNLNVTGSDGSDTFDVTPGATTTISVDGGLPTPPATPGDTLNVNLAGTTGASLTNSLDPVSGYFGTWSFTNAMPVQFSDIETLANVADLSIAKSDDHGGDSSTAATGSAVPGTSLTYTIVVTNTGLDDVTGATVDDTLPADFTGASYTATQTGGASGFTASGSGDIHDTVDMPVGSTITYVVSGTIGSAATGTLSNTATVTAPAGVFDNNTANNTATDSDTLTPTVDLTISKTDNSPNHPDVTQGTTFQYTITVGNTGPSDVSGALVTDAFPANFLGATYTATATGGASGFSSVGSGNISDTVNLPAGSTITYIVSGTADPAASGPLDNTATITAPAGVTNTNPNNTASDNLTETVPVDLSITKVDDQGGNSIIATSGSVTPGTALTYTITVSNVGLSDVSGASVADTFPTGFTGASFTATATGGASGFTANGNGDISDTVNLPAGSTIIYTVTGTVASSAVGTLSNTATVTAPAGSTDINTANNTATDTDNLTPSADITVSKTDDKGGNSTTNATGSVVAGTPLTYTVVVSNTGPSDVTAASITDALPSDFTGGSFTATATGGATGFTASGSGNISDTVDLPAGSSITYVITGTVAASATGTLANTANVGLPAGVNNTGNASATDNDTVTSSADITISKTDDKGGNSTTNTTGSVVAGTSLTYTVVVSNTGPSDVTGASITDALPSDFTGGSFTATATGGATGFTASGSGNISDTVNLPAGSSITYVITGTVASSATGTLANTANVGLPAGVNNTGNASATDNDTVTTSVDLTVSKKDDKGGDSTTSTTGSVVAGSSMTYTIVVSNTGPSDLTGAALADVLPTDFTGATFTATATGGATGFTSSGSGNISDTVNLPAGSSITYVVTGTVAASATGSLSNTADVTLPAGVTNSGNANATDTTAVTAAVAPTITSANSTDFAEGSFGTFTVTATGTAPITLTESGTLPTNVTFVDNGDGTATLSGTPPAGTAGVYDITITAHNGVSPDFVQSFTLTVSAAVVQSSPFGYLAGVPGDGTIQTFVQNLYRELLGREPDANGEAYWVGVLQQNDTAAGRQAVIQAFMNSQEYKEHYVTTLYEVFLGRAPDANGLAFWTGQMGNPGTPGGHNGSADEKFVLAGIVGSDEFYLDAGGTAQGFVNALYQDLFGRVGDSGGVDFWTGLVEAAPNNRDAIVQAFLSSPEAAHKLLDSFYPAPGGTATNPLPPPGSGVEAGAYDLAVVTGNGWENLYLQGPFDSQPQGNDQFFAELAAGGGWDDIELQLLSTDQYYTNPNRPVTS